jgi:hypothetical protein
MRTQTRRTENSDSGGIKNIQVIDGADNCTFSIFQATDKVFALIFPEAGQDIQFAEDLSKAAIKAIGTIWERPVAKPDANGIHGTIFYEFSKKRKCFPETKRERDWPAYALNPAQRRLYAKD